MNQQAETVVAIDAGGKANVGWVVDAADGDRERGTGATTLDELTAAVLRSMRAGRSVALGIEAPLYLPIATSEAEINSKRDDEYNRPWSAGAGAGVTGIGVHQLAYLLRGIWREFPDAEISFDLDAKLNGPYVRIWEAFVTGKAKSDSDEGDALRAIAAYRARATNEPSALDDEPPVINLAAAAAISAGFELETETLRTPCHVIRPLAQELAPGAPD